VNKTEFDYTYLRGFIREHFGTIQSFADFLGLGSTSVYERLANNVPFSQAEIDKVGCSATGRKLTAAEIDMLFFTHKIRRTV